MALATAVMTAMLVAGCAKRTPVNARLMSPYSEEKIWAVAPLANESGTSAADALRISDLLAQELQQVYRLNVVPVSRVLSAMEALEMPEIESEHDAQAIIRTLNLDGLLVGTITAYDPYHPPVLGLTVQLYTNGNEVRDRVASIDNAKGMRLLGASPSDATGSGINEFNQPVAGVSEVFDASDNGVRLDVQEFAQGRSDDDTALGWRRFLYSMDSYTQYAGHRIIRDLIREERLRVGRMMGSLGRVDEPSADDRGTHNLPPPA